MLSFNFLYTSCKAKGTVQPTNKRQSKNKKRDLNEADTSLNIKIVGYKCI
jgi:hypothetical protein